MDKYYYELKYVCEDAELTYKFSAELDIDTLADHLKDFLRGCSWSEKLTDELINGGN